MSPDDGWGAYEGPVTGGSAATPAHVYRVRTRAELARALAAGGSHGASDTPKIIEIDGAIDLSVDAAGKPLTEEDYRDPSFSWDDFARAYDVATWGRKAPAGPLEEARKRSADRQAAVVVLAVGSNTTLVGIGRNASISNGSLMVKDAHNVILRNLAFADAYDYFPAWDPNDNAHGEWNAAYDNVTLYNARRIWIDRCTFSDGARPDRINRSLLGRPMQFHDGLLDIVRGSDLVTVSNSHFRNHDKGMLIGNSDSRVDDEGRLRVTLHGNWFEDVKERSPRVRFGQVHVFNNLFTARRGADYPYGYSIGVGFGSRLIVENNVFRIDGEAPVVPFKWWKGERITARDNVLASGQSQESLDAIAMLTRQAGVPIGPDAGWRPHYVFSLTQLHLIEAAIRGTAGAGR